MIQHVWLIPALMALAALINGLGCRKLGKTAGHIAVGAMAITCVLSIGVFMQTRTALHEAEAAAAGITNEAARIAAVADLLKEKGTVKLFEWFSIPSSSFAGGKPLNVEFAFFVDPLSAIFLMFISFVGTLVFIYATGYMKERAGAHGHGDHDHDDEHGQAHGHADGHAAAAPGEWVPDPGYARFFAYVSLFAAMMYTLVLGDSLPVMFIGWEGVGLCSYLLIGYLFDKPFSEKLSCADAGRKAFVVNRIGDFGLMLGMFLLFWGLGTMNIQDIVSLLSTAQTSGIPAEFHYGGALITAAALLLFLGATGKSAQIPLFTWLPDAMAGPTPVSALIHAATMVTAGVYMVARLNVLYMMAPVALGVVAIIGALTAFVAAFAGLTQRGIKKALAYSTVSQLGYMFLAMGVGAFSAGIFHVFTHAFFKGCLFLAAGSVIHALHHEEDMFKMGGLRKKMPITAMTYFIATLCIAGIPPFSGFFSKDEILYNAFVSAGGGIPMLYIVGMVTALMTAIYMGRTYYLTFEGRSRVDPHVEAQVHESPSSMTMPLIILAAGGAIVGFLNVPHGLVSLGGFNEMFHHFISPVTDRGAAVAAAMTGMSAHDVVPTGAQIVAGEIAEHEGGHLELMLALLSAAVGAIGLFVIARKFYTDGVEREQKLAKELGAIYQVSAHRWWWDEFYDKVFKDGTNAAARAATGFDRGFIDGALHGIAGTLRGLGRELRKLQNGQVQIYGLVMILGAVAFVVYFALGLEQFVQKTPPPEKTPASAIIAPPAPTVAGIKDVGNG